MGKRRTEMRWKQVSLLSASAPPPIPKEEEESK